MKAALLAFAVFATPPTRAQDMTANPMGYDRAAINNAAYLSSVEAVCGYKLAEMIEHYRSKAISGNQPMEREIRSGIKALAYGLTDAARRHPSSFCAEARLNLPKLQAGLAKQ